MKAGLPESEWADHPARFAMAELNNIYDPALIWKQISDLKILKSNAVLLDQNEILNGNEIANDNSVCDADITADKISAAALGFHYAVTDMVIDMAESSGVRQIALCGGCFANRILLESCESELQKRGFAVYYNQKVSCGDGGISLGQAYYGLLRSSLCV